MSIRRMNRRQFLKALAVATGVAALSTLPSKWKTPVVEVGALPAHAQVSSSFGRITGLVAGGLTSTKTSNPSSVSIVIPGVSGATVTITDLSRSTTTDSTGSYTFNNVPPGSHTLQATADCYLASAPRNTTVPTGGTATVNFKLSVNPDCM